MRLDPHYNAIIDALERNDLDPTVFERCAVDLLRPEYPGLVPIPGGDDEGMDGAIPDEVAPLPLITTTSNRVLAISERTSKVFWKARMPDELSSLRLPNNSARRDERIYSKLRPITALHFAKSTIVGTSPIVYIFDRNGARNFSGSTGTLDRFRHCLEHGGLRLPAT